jgi:hypothetical protein
LYSLPREIEEKKATVKSKASGGVKFEATAESGGKQEFQLNFKDAEMEIKNKIDNKAVYTVESTVFGVVEGCDLKGTFVTPKGSCANNAFFSSISLGKEYKTADLNSSSTLKIAFDDETAEAGAFDYKGWSMSTLNAFKATNDLTVGFSLGGMTSVTMPDPKDEKKEKTVSCFQVPEMKIASTFNCGDMKLFAAVNGSFKSACPDYGFQTGAISTSLFQQVTKETGIACELSFGKESEKSGMVKAASSNGFGAKLGSSYSLSDSATLKSKLTCGCSKDTTLDFAWVQKLSSGSLTFAQQYGGASPSFSFSYTLDA